MEAAANVPSRGFYIKRFGSLAAAYSKIGYQPETAVREAKLRSIVESTAHEIVANVKKLGGNAAFCGDTCSLTLDERWTMSFYVAWSVTDDPGRDSRRWNIKAIARAKSDHAMLIRMTKFNEAIRDYYYLVPNFCSEFPELWVNTKVWRKAARCSEQDGAASIALIITM